MILPNDMSWSPPKENKKNKKDDDDDDDEGSEAGDGSFEEMGELAEDFASSEKLVAEIDQEFKELLD